MKELHIKFLEAYRKFFKLGTPANYNFVRDKIHLLKEPLLSQYFGEKEAKKADLELLRGKSDEEVYQTIKNIAAANGYRKTAPYIVGPQKDFKENKPDQFALWKEGYDYLREKGVLALRKLVSAEGDKEGQAVLMPVKDAIKRLKAAGIMMIPVNAGLTKGELVDPLGGIWIAGGKMKLNNAVAPFHEVSYNEDFKLEYNGKKEDGVGKGYYLKVVIPGGPNPRGTLVYPEGRLAQNKGQNFAAVKEFMTELPKARAKWLKWLQGAKKSKIDWRTLQGITLELVYQTSMRVGGSSKTTDGMTTLRVGDNISFPSPDTAVITYIGKSEVPQEHTIHAHDEPTTLLVMGLKKLCKGKDDGDWLLEDTVSGDHMDSGSATEAMREAGIVNKAVTIHKFRHARANEIAMSIFKDCPYIGKTGNDPKVVQKWYEAEMKKVGEQLGHKTMKNGGKGEVVSKTAIVNYIDPEVTIDFFERCKTRLPDDYAKIFGKH